MFEESKTRRILHKQIYSKDFYTMAEIYQANWSLLPKPTIYSLKYIQF